MLRPSLFIPFAERLQLLNFSNRPRQSSTNSLPFSVSISLAHSVIIYSYIGKFTLDCVCNTTLSNPQSSARDDSLKEHHQTAIAMDKSSSSLAVQVRDTRQVLFS